MSKPDYDVIVIGGGMVGGSLAALLADQRLAVAVVEAAGEAHFDEDSDIGLRVSAVSSTSRVLLERLGAWRAIAAARDGHGVSPYGAMHVWDAASPPDSREALHFDSADVGEPQLGHIVENQLITWAIARRLAKRREVTLFAPASLASLELDARTATVTLDDGRTLSARLVVGADGAGSQTRECAGIDVTGWSYGQRALVTHIRTEQDHERTAWQRFLPDGPLALLPLADGRLSVVWSTLPDHAAELEGMDEADFHAALAAGADRVLGGVTESGPRASFPLRLQHAKQYTGQRVALVGDAVHAVHPLAGQGLNMGFLDAAALAEVIADGLRDDQDIGDPVVLRQYERWRKGHNVAMMGSLDVLKRLFGARHEGVALLRRAGLGLVNGNRFAREQFVRAAMGSVGRVPRLLQTSGQEWTDAD
ncbi:MAG: UbiH/UbiF/VisC/COQ6 family ubiquinone biosynthesis hydroxylase [Pseudomonadota bacterium]